MADIGEMVIGEAGTDLQRKVAQALSEKNIPDYLANPFLEILGEWEVKARGEAAAYIPPKSDLMGVRQGGHCFFIDHPSGRVELIARYLGAGGEDRARRLFYDEHPEHFIPF